MGGITVISEGMVRAIYDGNVEKLKQFIISGIDVNGRYRGYTALHWATQESQLDVIKLLISLGADVNAKDEDD